MAPTSSRKKSFSSHIGSLDDPGQRTTSLSTEFVQRLRAPTREEASPTTELAIADLWLDDQPRQIVPDAILTALIAEDRAQPPVLLEALRRVAASHPYYHDVLRKVQELAASITQNGLLTPLLVIRRDGRPIIRDGHRRALASLIAGRSTVSALIVDEVDGVEALARQLVVNVQREGLTALEQARWLLRLARLVEEETRREMGLPEAPHLVDRFESPTDEATSDPHASSDDADGETAEPVLAGQERHLAKTIQERVCVLTGLSFGHYYRLLRLNRLSSEARDLGMGLTEKQLRPITVLPAAMQAEIVGFVTRHGLSGKEASTLVGVAQSGDRDAVHRVMARLSREDTTRQRAAVSWESLMHALPKDLWSRCAALRAELAALPEELREVRLRSMWEQRRLAQELLAQFDEILILYSFSPETPDVLPDPAAV